MDLYQKIETQLSQKLSLSPEMLQSLEIIQLSSIDLLEKINKELLENPALEIDYKKNKKKEADQSLYNIENTFSDDNTKFLDSSSADISSGVSPNSGKLDTKRQFLEGVISVKETLSDHLLWQLRGLNLNEKERILGETIISLIDHDGFFKYELEEIFSPEELAKARDILESIQLFDPVGIASKDVRSALLYQLETVPEGKLDRNAYIIVNEYFDLMINRKDALIAKNLGIKIEDVRSAFDFLSKFSPYPGREFDTEEIKYIIPDVYIYKRDDEIIVEINKETIPPLTISGYMDKISNEVKNRRNLEEESRYILDKVSQAKRFIYALRHRSDSLFILAMALSKYQSDFFYSGPKALKPLTMKVIAEEVGLSESTISRLASSKYIQTDWGLHEIKYFFTNSIGKSGENEKSSESVRELIKEIILNEKEGKITDQKISQILENKGIKIARRTVAKYRKKLDILPSHYRKL